MKTRKAKGAFLLFFLLMVFWLILSSGFDLTQILVGVLASLLVVFYSYDMIFSREEATTMNLKSTWAFFLACFRLIIEIFKANISVVKIVLSKKMPIDPGIVLIRQPLKREFNQTFYANAISLTPGTLTIDITEEGILVHGLQKESIKSLEGSKLESAFIRLEETQ